VTGSGGRGATTFVNRPSRKEQTTPQKEVKKSGKHQFSEGGTKHAKNLKGSVPKKKKNSNWNREEKSERKNAISTLDLRLGKNVE